VKTITKCLFLIGVGLVAFGFTRYALLGALTIPTETKTLKAVERMAPETFDNTMTTFMAEYRQGLPKVIDDAVTLELADYAGGVVTYTYHISIEAGISEELIDAIMADISDDHTSFNCQDKVRRAWLDKGVTIVHNYNVEGIANYSGTMTVGDCSYTGLI
jgi:hypothetical protein